MKEMLTPLFVLVWTKLHFASAFSFQAFASPQLQPQLQRTLAVDIEETAQRDLSSLQQWAQNCGIQTAQGCFELTSQDGEDWTVFTTKDTPAGTPLLFVPSSLVLSSADIASDLGGNLEATENTLLEYEETRERLPLFRLLVKILTELEAGYESPYYPWLNSLPRRFYNGVAMTDACFDCLPPYAAWLSMKERNNYSRFLNAIREGYLELSEETLNDDALIKWAYNVALTRHQEVWVIPREDGTVREKKISPMADLLNHATIPNAAIEYDDQGNCVVTTTQDVPAGSPLTISLGDPTNPTPLFAKYGFLYDINECTSIFCKAMHLQKEIETLGYDFQQLLFYTQTGDIAPAVWDLFLYNLLQNDPQEMQAFFYACTLNDEATKQAYHQHYFPYTLEALKQYVNGMLQEIDTLTRKANSYNVLTHPRVPIIVAHNNLVADTFLKVKAQLDAMG